MLVPFDLVLCVLYAALGAAAVTAQKLVYRSFIERNWGTAAKLGAVTTVLYATTFSLMVLILARMPISAAVPITVGLSLIGVSVAASWVFHERQGPSKLAGNGLIICGAILLVLSR